jgi:anti-sigma-K factor RskA
MNEQKIIESGLLELYVMGSLAGSEKRIVEHAIKEIPSLRNHIYEIENALYKFADAHAIQPPSSLKNDILKQIRNQPSEPQGNIKQPPPSNGKSYLSLFLVSTIAALGMIFYSLSTYYKYQSLESDYNRERIICDSLAQVHQSKQLLLANLARPGTKALDVEATDKFPTTSLVLHYNEANKSNHLHLYDLPPLLADQSYQLWSLRDGEDPMPLEVFQGDDNIFEVTYVDNTSAYAITIEKSGGSQSPDLTNLIGVIPVS